MVRYNIVKNIRKRKIIILVLLLILIMVSWVIWGNLSVETNHLTVTFKDLPEAFDNFSIAHNYTRYYWGFDRFQPYKY